MMVVRPAASAGNWDFDAAFEFGQLLASIILERIAGDQKRSGPLLDQRHERGVDVSSSRMSQRMRGPFSPGWLRNAAEAGSLGTISADVSAQP
jgi:hypothetical protein